jgi:hypothetical protein
MATLKVSIDIELNGVRVQGFPMVRRVDLTEVQNFNVIRATAGGYVALPLGELTTLQALLLTSDKALSVQLGATEEADITLASDGLILIIDGSNTASNAKASNASGVNAQIEGLGGGV